MTEKELTMLALDIAYTILSEYNNRLTTNVFVSMGATEGRKNCVRAVYNALKLEGFEPDKQIKMNTHSLREMASELVWTATYSMAGAPNRQNQSYFTSAVDEVADILFDFIVEKKLGGLNA